MWKTKVSFLLIIVLLHQVIAIESLYAAAGVEAETKSDVDIKSRVEGLGVGAVVVVYLKDNIKEQGQIGEISAGAFKLVDRNSTKSISYDLVRGIVPVTNYKAHGAPDPDRVRQTVVNIGIGKNATVKRPGERLTGTIQEIGVQSFTVRSSKTGQLQVVSFSEVSEIKAKTFPKWAVGAIVAGAVVGVLMGAMLAACGTGGC